MENIFRTVALITAVFVAGQVHVAAGKGSTRTTAVKTLRASDPQLGDVLEQGLARSSTLRELDNRLERLPVIVYLERATLPAALVGRTRLIGAGGGWRYLLVEIDSRTGPLSLLATIGHELQHAVEIAEAAEVVDAETLTGLYRRIGLETAATNRNEHWFETSQALEAGRRVRTELQGMATDNF